MYSGTAENCDDILCHLLQLTGIVPLPRLLPSAASRSGSGFGDDRHSPLTGFETLSGVGFRGILNTQMSTSIGSVKNFLVL